MRFAFVLVSLTCSLLAAGQAGAESWMRRLTPDKPDGNFSIKVDRQKDAETGEYLQFRVTVKLTDIKELPKRSRTLRIFNGKEFISACEVQPTGSEGERVYSFRVAAKYLEKSTFSYSDADNFDHIGYWFYLKDFVESK
jgi:hypothetical protein